MATVKDVLKYQDKGLSVEEAKKRMVEAGEASGSSGKVAAASSTEVIALEPPGAAAAADVLEPPLEEIAPAPAAALGPSAPVAPVFEPTSVERVETDQFVGEIKQEKGQWVAEIQYKSGAGPERFIAASKSALMLALLKGKGHATLRVREAVRREKLGGPQLDREYPLPVGVTADDFSEMSEKQQDILLYTIASQQTLMFRDAHPEFYPTKRNAEVIDQYFTERKLPLTLRNLEYAFEDLAESGLLEERPAPIKQAGLEKVLSVPVSPPVSEDSVPVSTVPVVASATPAPVATGATVRKRGTSGLQPGQASTPSELTPEKPVELSEAELRKLPMPELKRIADQDRRARSGGPR